MNNAIEQVADRIVEKEVIYCVSMLVSSIAKEHEVINGLPIDEEDIMSIMIKSDYDELPDGYRILQDEEGMWAFSLIDGEEDDYPEYEHDTEEEAIKAAWEDSGEEPPTIEALEHWIVSDWLADKLEAEGEMICRDFVGLTIWGRVTSGQHIAMDYVIQKIAEKLNDTVASY